MNVRKKYLLLFIIFLMSFLLSKRVQNNAGGFLRFSSAIAEMIAFYIKTPLCSHE